MTEPRKLTTEAGAPVVDNQHSQTAGPTGPTLLQDHYLLEKLARFDRERIPERVVHAVGSGAYGYLEVTSAVMKEDERPRLIETIAGSLAQVTRPDVIDGSIEHFRRADREYGDRLAAAVAARRR
jgi:catalase